MSVECGVEWNKHRTLIQLRRTLVAAFVIAAAAVATISLPSAQAATENWTGATGGQWGTNTNWSSSVTPDSTYDLTILGPANAAGALTINVAAPAAADSINFTDTSAVTLNNTTSNANQTLTIAGAAGITTGSGAVTIGSAASTQNVNVVLGSSQTWNVGSGGLTITNVISDGGSAYALSKIGTGTLTLTGANTFTGGLFIKAGTVIAGAGGSSIATSYGNGPITIGDATVGADATLNLPGFPNNSTASITIASGAGARTILSSSNNSGQLPIFGGTVTLNNTLTLGATNVGGIRFNGVISEGTVGMAVVINSAGSGVVRLGNANTFTGGVTVQQGTLEMTGATGAGSGTITIGNTSGSGNATVSMNTSAGFTVANAITVASGNSGTSTLQNVSSGAEIFGGAVALNHALTLAATNTGALTLSGAITGSSSLNIASTGAGFVNLSNASNTITGGITISQGTLAATGATGSLGTGTVTIGAASGSNAATLTGSGNTANTVSNAITVASGGTGVYTIVDTAGSDFDLSGPITLNNALTFKTTSGGAIFENGVITGSSALIIDGGATTTKFVSFAADSSSTYTGSSITVQNKGTLKFGLNNAIGTSAAVTIDATSIIDGGGKAMSFGGLNGVSGSSVLNNGTSLTLGGAGTYTFAGVIGSGGSLIKNGIGSQTLSGSDTYSGGTTVNLGTLALGNAAGLGSATAALTINGGTLDIGALSISTGAATLAGGTIQNGTLTATSYTASGGTEASTAVLAGSGAFTQTGGSTSLNGNNTYTGATTINSGATIKLGNAAALGSTSTGTTISSGGTLDLNGQTGVAEGLTIVGTGVAAGGALINSSSTAASVTSESTSNSSFTVGGTGDITLQRVTMSNPVTNNVLTKIGTGTLTLGTSGATTHDNLLALDVESASTVNLGMTGSNIAVDRGLIVNAGGTVKFTGNSTLMLGVNNAIAINNGTLNLNGMNSNVGTANITVGNGTNNGVISGGSASVFTTSGTFAVLSGSADVNLAGAGSVSKTTAGTVTFSRANSYAGGTSVAAGTLATSGSGALGTGNVTVADASGAILTLANAVSISDAGTLTFGTNSAINLNAANGTSETVAAITDSTTSNTLSAAGTYLASDLNTYFGVSSFNSLSGETVTIAPEPSSLAVIGFGALGLLTRRRRKAA